MLFCTLLIVPQRNGSSPSLPHSGLCLASRVEGAVAEHVDLVPSRLGMLYFMLRMTTAV